MAELAVVTVSYGDRVGFLARQAEALAAEPAIREWIVVANGNADLVRAAALEVTPRIVALTENAGSAVGFSSGLSAALGDASNRRVLLLDDDNLPRPGTIDGLLALNADAVAAYRPRLYWAEARGIVARRADSCLGFHLGDLPAKLWRRLFGAPALRPQVTMPGAGYGGLMVRRELVERIGLPDPLFMLYADDTEWTMRAGGVVLATGLLVDDLDGREPAGAGAFSLGRWLDAGDDFRLFYGARNEAYVDRFRLRRNRLVHAANRAVALGLLRLSARGKEREYALLREAVAAGEAGRLGGDPRFRLPGAR